MVTVQTEAPVESAESTLYIKKSDLADVLIGKTTAAALFVAGKMTIDGNQQLLANIVPNLDEFDASFEILPLLD
jgi:alkyl sulfatase BDS1-like metallo-beta-lactamase superfamily hydrolase